MAIETRCHGCGKRLRVADEYAGRQARCPECGYVYTVSAATMPAGGATAAAPEQPLAGPAAGQGAATGSAHSTSASATSGHSPTTGPLPQAASGDNAWYMKTPEGQIYGPVTRNELDQWVRDGRVSDDCQLRRGDHGSWFGSPQAYPHLAQRRTAVQSATGGAYANPYASRQAGPNFAAGGRYVRPHRGGMIIAFAIIGWVVTCPIFSIMAWVMGNGDLQQMRAGQMDNSGMSLTQAGQILGMIHTCLTILGFVLVMLLAMCSAAANGM